MKAKCMAVEVILRSLLPLELIGHQQEHGWARDWEQACGLVVSI